MSDPSPESVSVVIPVFNAARHLDATLASVFAQTFTNLEIVAVDDGSADRSLEILARHGDRVRLVQQANAGSAVARNRGVEEARGTWIAFLDADDLWSPDKVQRQLDECRELPWSYTDSVFLGGVNDGRRDSELSGKPRGHVLEALVRGNFISTSTVMIRREVFLASGGFDASLRSIQDWECWIRIAAAHPIGYVDAPLMKYRVHSTSTSRKTRVTLPNHLAVIDRIFTPGGPASSLQHLKPAARAQSFSICSHIAEEEGDYAFALQCAWHAYAEQPLEPSGAIRTLKSLVKWLIRRGGASAAQ
jgi:glycosyltransferase involved in cell wall biosynthesis